MPCLQYKKLNTKNEFGTKYAYVPCGQCVDCRKKLQNAWKFRLNAEFSALKKKGWNLAFCTLTYNDNNLPKIPKSVFKNDEDYREIKCFSRKDVREFIDNVRNYCKYHYRFVNDDNIRYFISSEYGSNTKRPHYHMIMAWPSKVGYRKMHEIVSKYWNYGYLFPRDYRGDAQNGCLSFEIVGDATKALSYVSKYVCKDLDFIREIKGIEFNENMRLYKDIQPFHIQSRSLGFESIKNMSDEEKREVFIKGMSFVGDGQIYQIPMYIKNKIVYDNYYILEKKVDAKGNEIVERMVKRKASAFFEKYRQEMFNEKAKFYTKLFAEGQSNQYYIDRGVDKEMAEKFASGILRYRSALDRFVNGNGSGDNLYTNDLIGKLYLAYFGVKNSSCYAYESEKTKDYDLCEQWMLRYRELKDINNNEKVIINSQAYYALQNFCSLTLGCLTYCNISKIEEREDEERRLARIRDFYNNVLAKKL